MRLLISAALLVALFGIGGTRIDLAAAPAPSAVPVKVTFADTLGDQIASDLRGPYLDGSGVYAAIEVGNGGNLVMYGKASKTVPSRQFRFTFDNCLGTCGVVPFTSDLTAPQFIFGVRRPDGTQQTGGLLGMPIGVDGYRSGLKVYFGTIGTASWTLCLTPAGVDNYCANASRGSTPTRIVRTAPDSWTISASATNPSNPTDPAPRSDVGKLLMETGTGRQSAITTQGTYAMPFAMTVQCVTPANCS